MASKTQLNIGPIQVDMAVKIFELPSAAQVCRSAVDALTLIARRQGRNAATMVARARVKAAVTIVAKSLA